MTFSTSLKQVMTIYDQLVQVLSGQEGRVLSTKEIKSLLRERFHCNPASVIPSDFCYNRRNEGVPHTRHLFEYLERGSYRYLGPGRPYTGQVFARRRGTTRDELVGEWRNGERPPILPHSERRSD